MNGQIPAWLVRVLDSELVWRVGWGLVHSVWQGAAVALGLALLLRISRRARSSAGYLMSCAALLASVALPAATACLVAGRPTRSMATSTTIPIGAGPAVASAATGGMDATPAEGPTPNSPRSGSPRPRPDRVDRPPAGPQPVDAPTSTAADGPTLSALKPATPPVTVRAAERAGNSAFSSSPWPQRVLPWVVLGWASGSLGFALWHLGGWASVQRLRTRSTQPVTEAAARAVAALSRRLGIRRQVRLLGSTEVDSPLVIGALRPLILLPASLLTGMSPAQLDAILAHELAHVRRHDYLANLVQTAIETLLFYHPAAWWISRQVRTYREHCCDDIAIGLTSDRKTYVHALTAVAAARVPRTAPAAASGGTLLPRVRRILGMPDADAGRGSRWLAVFAAGALCLALGLSARSSPPTQEQAEAPTTAPTSSYVELARAKLGVQESRLKLTKAELDLERVEDLYGDLIKRGVQNLEVRAARLDVELRQVELRKAELALRSFTSAEQASSSQPAAARAGDDSDNQMAALAEAKVKAAEKTDAILQRQQDLGELITPEFALFRLTVKRQIADAKIAATVDAAARKKASEDYLNACSRYQQFLHERYLKGIDASEVASSQAAFYVKDAEILVAKTRLENPSEGNPERAPRRDAGSAQSEGGRDSGQKELPPETSQPPVNATTRPQTQPRQAVTGEERGDSRPIPLRVVDTDGRPLAGVRCVIDADEGDSAREASTGNDGEADLVPAAGAKAPHALTLSKAGLLTIDLADAAKTIDARREGERLALTLFPSATYRGRVVDEAGKPVAGAKVAVSVANSRATQDVIWDRATTPLVRTPDTVATDANGRWVQHDVDANGEPYVTVTHTEYLSDDPVGQYSGEPSAAALRDGSAVSVLRAGVVVRGVVRDENDHPIAGASVSRGNDHFDEDLPATTTDADGVFVFSHVPPGALTLTAKAGGHSPALRTINTATHTPPVSFKLEKANTLRLRVTDTQGHPLNNVWVTADTWRGARTLGWEGTTDNGGRVTWPDAPADEVLFDIIERGETDRFMARRKVPLVANGQEQTVIVSPPLVVRGSVVDDESGKSIDRFTVRTGVYDRRPPSGDGNAEGSSPARWRGGPSKPTTDGKFEVTFTEPAVGHAVRIEADGYLPAESKPFFDSDPPQTFDVRLKRAGEMSGLVRLPDGSPAAGVKVLPLAEVSFHTLVDQGRFLPQPGQRAFDTDAAGRYRMPTRYAGLPLVFVDDRGYAERSGAALRQSTDITLAAWGAVTGVVTVGGRPQPGLDVTVARDGGLAKLDVPVRQRLDTTTDAEGRFTVKNVPPGKIKLLVTRPGEPPLEIGRRVLAGEVKPGQTLSFAIGQTGRPVAGRVQLPVGANLLAPGIIHLNAKPAADVYATRPADFEKKTPVEQLRWWLDWELSEEGQRAAAASPFWMTTSIGQDGAFRFDDVPPGDYVLEVYGSPATAGLLADDDVVVRHELTVPTPAGGYSAEPLSVGVLEAVAGGRAEPNAATRPSSTHPSSTQPPSMQGAATQAPFLGTADADALARSGEATAGVAAVGETRHSHELEAGFHNALKEPRP